MANYGSNYSEQPGQYPAPNFTVMGLPSQNFGSGAPGGSPTSSNEDPGGTNQPGQYPDRDTLSGVAYSLGGMSGSGAPGTAGISGGNLGGGDSVTFDRPTFYKGEHEDGNTFDRPDGSGYEQEVAQATVSGKGDWTQANSQGYQAAPQYQAPGVAGNTPAPGDGHYQTGAGSVLYGGWLKGSRPGTSQHPGWSGPGT